MCEYEYLNEEKCQREVLEGSEKGYCLLHEDWDNKDVEKTREQFYQEIKDGETNFEGCVLPGFDLSEKEIEENLNFRKALVKAKSKWDNTIFKKEADFGRDPISKGAYFIFARFGKGADFLGAKFSKGVSFNSVKFMQDAVFTEVTFLGRSVQIYRYYFPYITVVKYPLLRSNYCPNYPL